MPIRQLCPYFLCACLLLTACNPVVNFFAFHPDDSYIQPSEALPPGTEEIFFEAEDGVRIQAFHLHNPSSDIITIYFHGNAGNIYHRLNDYRRLRRLGTGVFAVSYRGYAKSEGSPSEAGIYRDGKAAFDHVTKVMGYPPSRIFIFGRSIGSTVATDLARDKDIAGLILVSPLSSARDQASVMGLGFAAPLTGNAFENDKKIKRLKAPLVVIHGTRDRIIPIGMGRNVFDAAIGQKYFREIEGAGHNDLSNRFADDYWAVISDFLKHSPKNR
jgi:fermentation-respiration switch protein FrsA (DUF1100 family)